MTQQVRVGIIGCGMMGRYHTEQYTKMPGVQVLAVTDILEDVAKKLAADCKVPHVYTDFRKMLAMPEIDAIDVCLHNNLHAPATIASLRAGKHVYCEKPMAGAYADAAAMHQAAVETGRKLHIQLATLYSAEHKVAKRLIDDGHLGKPYYARSFGFRRRGRPYVDGYGTRPFVQKGTAAGGAMFDMGVYHIAEVLHLLNNPQVLTVTGSTHQKLPMYPKRAEEAGYSVEELGLGYVRLAGDLTLAVEESWAVHYDNTESSKILGPKGGLKLSPFAFFSTVGDVELDATADLGKITSRWRSCEPDFECYENSQKHWVAALQGRVPLLDTAGVALNTALISEGIYLSQALQREVTGAEIVKRSESKALKI